MIEIRFHGRGGQGMKTAAKILARAAYIDGKWTQDFSMYGAERRGAPVTAFVRFDTQKIMTCGYIFTPDILVIGDDSLNLATMLKGLKPTASVLINTGNEPDFLKRLTNARIYWVNATGIAVKLMGMPVFNSALLGALVRMIRSLNLQQLNEAIAVELEKHGKELVEKNQRLAEMGFNKVVRCQ